MIGRTVACMLVVSAGGRLLAQTVTDCPSAVGVTVSPTGADSIVAASIGWPKSLGFVPKPGTVTGWVTDSAGGTADIRVRELATPAPGTSALVLDSIHRSTTAPSTTRYLHVQYTDLSGKAQTSCVQLHFRVDLASGTSPMWMVGNAVTPSLDLSVLQNQTLGIRVVGRDLWKDMKLSIGGRAKAPPLSTPVVSRFVPGPPDTIEFSTARIAGADLEGGRYSLTLSDGAWAGNTVRIPGGVIAAGHKPLLFAVGGAPLGAPIVNFVLPGYDLADAIVQMAPVVGGALPRDADYLTVRSTIAGASEDTLNVVFSPAAGVSQYAVRAKNIDGLVSVPIILNLKREYYEAEAVRGLDQSSPPRVFAGIPDTLVVTLPPAQSGLGVPNQPVSVTVTNGAAARAYLAADNSIVVEGVRVNASAGGGDPFTGAITIHDFPAVGSVGTAMFPVNRIPTGLRPDSIVLYGPTPQRVQISGDWLSSVTLGTSLIMEVSDLRTSPTGLSFTATPRTISASDTLWLYRGTARVASLPVRVAATTRIEELVRIAKKSGAGCPATTKLARPDSHPLRLTTSDVVCVGVAAVGGSAAASASDTVEISLWQAGRQVGPTVQEAFIAGQGSDVVEIPLSQVVAGQPISISVGRPSESPENIAGAMRVTDLWGFAASVSAASISLGRPSRAAQAAQEAAASTFAMTGAGAWFSLDPYGGSSLSAYLSWGPLTRSFCGGANATVTALGVGVLYHSTVSAGIGLPLESASLPTSCDGSPTSGTTNLTTPTVPIWDRGRPVLFLGAGISVGIL